MYRIWRVPFQLSMPPRKNWRNFDAAAEHRQPLSVSSLRARIILARADGSKEEDVAAKIGVSLNTVSLWSKRFEEEGLAGLVDKAGRGRKAFLSVDKVRQAITTVTQPPPGRQRWSTRSMGAALGFITTPHFALPPTVS